MELSKKTTILFSPKSHRQLSDLAERRGVSLGELGREACAPAYGIVDQEAVVEAAAAARAVRRHSPPGAWTLPWVIPSRASKSWWGFVERICVNQ